LGARLLSAAAVGALSTVVIAQQPQPRQPSSADIDPSAPLAPMPGIGVDWPTIGKEAPPQHIPGAPQRPVIEAETDRSYSISVQGMDHIGNPAELIDQFQQQSALYQDRKSQANAAQIERRAQADADLLRQILRSRGYYDADVEPSIQPQGQALLVTLTADPGQQYQFQSVELPGLAAAGPEADKLRQAFAAKAGDPVVAEDVIAAGIALKVALGRQGFALAKVGDQQVTVDHQTHLASLVLPVDPGPVARFGAIRVSGRPPFDARHVQEIARFRPGDRFRQDKVDDLRRALIATGLLASAEVKVVPEPNRDVVDLDVAMQPAPPRTVAGELGYGTGEGVSLQGSWEHRNLFPPEGALTLRGIAGTREQLAGVQFRRNNFKKRDQVLNLQLVASHTKYDAYTAKTIDFAADFERQSNIIWRKKWTWSVGTELLATDEFGIFHDPTQKQTKTFAIAALPLGLAYDGSNDLLNPTKGFRLSWRLSPEYSLHGGSFGYGRAQFDASAYQPLSSSIVLGGRIRLGTIFGASALDIAPSRRFYSGGGGSVRGYGYQRIGPLDAEGDPIGGRGLAEFGLEARFRFGNLGVVPFLDGGSLTEKAAPDLRHWQLGTGLGFRYYSNFGPIRVDIGTPLNRRPGDSRIAVAVSLGQAF
jgi:translocation and assembly module TamA